MLRFRDQEGLVGRAWRTLETRAVYDGAPWVRVELEKVELPDGRVVEDYHRIETGRFATVMPVDETGRFLCLGQYRHGASRAGYAMAGGRIETGEDPAKAAARELTEEMGLTAAHWTSLGVYPASCSYGFSENHLFLARELSPVAEKSASDDLETSLVIRLEREALRSALLESKEFLALGHVAGFALALLQIEAEERQALSQSA